MKQFVITAPFTTLDFETMTSVVQQGIDAHLEAFTKSTFITTRTKLVLNFDLSELSILLRRLEEIGTINADLWISDIVYIHYGREI